MNFMLISNNYLTRLLAFFDRTLNKCLHHYQMRYLRIKLINAQEQIYHWDIFDF